jgi:cytochrome c553
MKTLISCFALTAVVAVAVSGCGSSDTPANCSTDSVSEVDEGPLMKPGGACIECHTSEGEGPIFKLAGTVMAATNDDTSCNGVSGVTVEITGADNQVITLTTNSAGNFFLENGSVALPYTAKVKAGGKELVMGTAQSVGDCNTCHTAGGSSGAPGRILSPG